MKIIKIKASDFYEKKNKYIKCNFNSSERSELHESFWLLFESSIKLSNGSPFIRNQINNLSKSELSEREIFLVRYFRVKS